ncbi:conserved hypothetical protein [Theileria equi strain WA]|uniref:Uncharacterized protein n=1 Tax=Theileria equi strain WA TaxID=1537102 RepID=L1LCD5_THEEQ|nr:conserved hypothetical protein [Theileria equi strain WA]EKX73006.1 conserved hypothetical protein [Theileria equi strain WA]|eukprot:XP_004832458.1 conserved hypothetical protein [Theileria equi strain WA]
MAYRYMRHGLYTRRKKLTENGFRPFVDDLMWNITDWHYKYYMNKVARASLLTKQREIEEIYQCIKGNDNMFLRTATPNIVPYRKQSNPFCSKSQNMSGWEFEHRTFLKTPKPYRNRKIGGTVISVPKMPKH